MAGRQANHPARNPLPSRRRILSHFNEHDAVMAAVIKRIGPLQLQRNGNYFIVLCKSIVSQQISTSAAHTIYLRFHELFQGRSPTPERVLSASPEALRSAGLSRQKAAYLHDLSRRFLDRSIRPRQLAYLSNEEIILRLTAVHGIGRWTAEMFLIFSLNRLAVLPLGDLGLRSAIQKIYSMKALPSPQQLRALGQRWHPLETVATWYCWRLLDDKIVNY